MTEVTCPTCPHCRLGSTLEVPEAGLTKWRGGDLIQNAFPELTADQREQLLTGIHSKCWDAMMGPEED